MAVVLNGPAPHCFRVLTKPLNAMPSLQLEKPKKLEDTAAVLHFFDNSSSDWTSFITPRF
ncbi:hypothetical protein [Limnohabitans sp. Bal53]|uniref:hypothetical protein n=1 Tax=Limnohabitans sp. Bal53 TaxID=1977910 RepID=UPI001304CA10|nr:hypothetical protein [Limnohabitans sp. Bal53]